jgi:hypothetical protein
VPNLFTRLFCPLHTLVEYNKPLTGIALSIGMATVGLPQWTARGAEAPAPNQASQVATLVSQSVADQPLPDGVYLYGQAQEPEQIGSAYMIFEVNDAEVVGAFYMPQSSFDCFYGDMQTNELALTVIDSYEQTPHPYSVALEQSSDVADAGNPAIAPVELEGFNRIDTVSENDQRILQTCQADHQERVQ